MPISLMVKLISGRPLRLSLLRGRGRLPPSIWVSQSLITIRKMKSQNLYHNLATNTPPWLCDCGFCVFVFVQKLKLIFNPTLPTFQFSLVQLNVVQLGTVRGVVRHAICSPHMQSTFKQATKLNYSLQIVDIWVIYRICTNILLFSRQK